MQELVFTLDTATVDHFSKEEIQRGNPNFESSASIVIGLRAYFDLSKIRFLTPSSLKGDQRIWQIQGNLFVPSYDRIDAERLIILAVDTEEPSFGLEDLAQQYSAYGLLSSQIGRYMNPLASKRAIDKRDIYSTEVAQWLPPLLDSSSWESLEEQVKEQQLVLKHRMGAGGQQVYLLNQINFKQIKSRIGVRLPEYVAQSFVPSFGEKRLVIFGLDIVGTRRIQHRNHPWEKRECTDKQALKKNVIIDTFDPDQTEISQAMETHKECGLDYSCIDFLETPTGSKMLEVNGIHPGMISPRYPGEGLVYDLGNRFAQFIYDTK